MSRDESFETTFIAASGWGLSQDGVDEAISAHPTRGEIDRFRRSEFFADLKSGRRVVEFEYAAKPGNWARKKKRVLPPEFWTRTGWIPVEHPAGLIIWDPAARTEYINGVVCWADAPAPGARATVPRHPPETHSGSPGRPTSRHLYEAELERRYVASEMLAQLGKEAAALLAWVKAKHPKLNAGSLQTVENNIRLRHRALKATKKPHEIIDRS